MNTRVFFISAAAIVLAACSRIENPVQSNIPVSLTYSTVSATETKAAQNLNEGTFASGESVTVRISNTGAGEWTNYTFTTGEAGAMNASGTAPYYPAGPQNIDIAAYYPASAGTSFTVASDQTDDVDYKASDLMFASATNQAKQAEAVELAFAHKMAKLNVNITAGDGVTSITSLSVLNVKPTVSFDQETGAVGTASGDPTSIAMSNNGGAVFPAQTINGGLLSIVTDKGIATYTVANKEFAAGQQYTLNITVNLRAVGTTTAITGWAGEGTVIVNPVVFLKAVDLGLSVKWANMNVGAEAETDFGDHFAWGETSGYGSGKTVFSWSTYKWMQEGKSDWKYITKYTAADDRTEGIWYDGDTFIGDGKTSLQDYDKADDAAYAALGENFRMPTDAEWTELRENCSWTWKTTSEGYASNGYLVTGPSGNTIFLPAAGYRNTSLVSGGSYGYYWSSSLRTDYSGHAIYEYLTFDEHTWGTYSRFNGLSIRPVWK